jgi:hypothetical protein
MRVCAKQYKPSFLQPPPSPLYVDFFSISSSCLVVAASEKRERITAIVTLKMGVKIMHIIEEIDFCEARRRKYERAHVKSSKRFITFHSLALSLFRMRTHCGLIEDRRYNLEIGGVEIIIME